MMRLTITININMDSAAFSADPHHEVYCILARLACQFQNKELNIIPTDSNGVRCGEVTLVGEELCPITGFPERLFAPTD